MSDVAQVQHETEEEVQWRITLRQAWIDTTMEVDRTLMGLSAGGVAMLVTLLSTSGTPSGGLGLLAGLLYLVAFLAFLVAISCGIKIYRANAIHLRYIINRAGKTGQGGKQIKSILRTLDRRLRTSFWIGVWFSFAVGAVTASSKHIGQREEPVPENKPADTSVVKGVQETPSGYSVEKSSLLKIDSIAPVTKPAERPAPDSSNQQGGDSITSKSGGSK